MATTDQNEPDRAASPSSRRDWILWWWPAAARVVGAAVGLYAASPLTESQDKAAILAFAGALVVAPNSAGRQRERNHKRGLDGPG